MLNIAAQIINAPGIQAEPAATAAAAIAAAADSFSAHMWITETLMCVYQ